MPQHDNHRIFISYSSADRPYADRLVSALLLNGFEVWYDQFDLRPGDEIYRKIVEGIINVKFVGVVITASSLASTWVSEEMTLAKQRELEEKNILLLPLRFEQVEIPLHLRTRKYADFTDFDTGLADLFRALDTKLLVKPLDSSVFRKIHALLETGPGAQKLTGVRQIQSQSAARLVAPSALPISNAEAEASPAGASTKKPDTVLYINLQSIGIVIPISVVLTESVRHVLARVVEALRLPNVVHEQRVSFFLLHNGVPLELDDRLDEAGVPPYATLQMGIYTYLIE
jgi:hypothetical protein